MGGDASIATDDLAGPADLAGALARLEVQHAVSLPLLGAQTRRRLIGATSRLPYRPAIPVVGTGANVVRQDFELCMAIPERSPLRAFAACLERLLNAALDRLKPRPLAQPLHLNDAIVQRYLEGSFGITAHRDHVRYQGLVALVTLSGTVRFCLCDDRAGQGMREIPCPPGSLLLMRAPGFGG
ncbi:MAG: hypothetical protein ACTSQ7_13425 [Alphaproteobacteria bacterium]